MQRANDGMQRATNPTLKRRVELHISNKRMMRRKRASVYAPFKGGQRKNIFHYASFKMGQRKIFIDISIRILIFRRIG